jgi:hypothetical protein
MTEKPKAPLQRPGGTRGKFSPSRPVFWRSWVKSVLAQDTAALERYCMFLGNPRSGHTLIGSLLNAHPEMVLANELDALAFIEAGYSRRQLFWLIHERDRWFARSGSRWEGYSYKVPGQWQGKYESLRVIGDKKASRSTLWLGYDPTLLDALAATVRLPMHLFHIVRNPFDNITTMARKSASGSLDQAIDFYFGICSTVQAVESAAGAHTLVTLRHEAFIEDPPAVLAQMCAALGLDASAVYLDACAGIVFKSPNQTRTKIDWPAEAIARVNAEIEMYRFLRGYHFDSV